MQLCIRNRVKNANFIIHLIIRYLINKNTKAIADIYATLLRIQNFYVLGSVVYIDVMDKFKKRLSTMTQTREPPIFDSS